MVLDQSESVRGVAYEPTKIYAPIRVLEFGVLEFKAVLDLTGAAFLGAAGTRRRVARFFGEPTLPTFSSRLLGSRVSESDLIQRHQPIVL